MRELVQALRQLAPGDDFTFLAPFGDPSAPADVQIVPTLVRRPNLAKLDFEQRVFPRAARRGSFQLAHVPHFGPPVLPSLPTIVTIHDLIPLILPAYRGSLRVRLYTRLAALGARRAQAVVADSDACARDIATHLRIPRARIHTVYLAAGARYQPARAAEPIQRVREKYRLPERFLLYLGGFDVRKNVPHLIGSFARLREEHQAGWKLVLAGPLPDSESAFFPDPRRATRAHQVQESVQLIGFVAEEDKPALYSAARAFLYPSEYEGFGLPPLEAMACGTPVIASNRASLPEVVGDAGWLLEPYDVGGWCEALRALIHDDALVQERRERGLAQAGRFSWERAGRETLAIYRQVLQNSPFSLQSLESG